MNSEKSVQIKIMRVYNAPLRAVWEAWTDPEKLTKWWGPRGFSITSHSKELAPGGHWRFTMHSPDGVDYPNDVLYREVESLKRLVYDHGASQDEPPLFCVTVCFNENKGKTHMDMIMTLPTPEAAEQTKKVIQEANGYSTWDRLAEYLENEASGKQIFVISRSFYVDMRTMFNAWTQADQIAQWSGPAGAQIEYINVDIRNGGGAFYRMPMADSVTYGRVHYLEVTPLNRLVYVQQFADEKGQPARHPMSPTWPQSMLTTIAYVKEELDQTRVTLAWEIYGDSTQEEIDTFVKAKEGISQGWSGSFKKLQEHLKS